MAQVTREVVGGRARYDGRTLVEWVPEIVARIVERFDPLEIILFGSVATGEDGPDSDIDLLVVFPPLRQQDKLRLMAELIAAATVAPPVDVIPTDRAELERLGHRAGTVLRPALRQGRRVYERSR